MATGSIEASRGDKHSVCPWWVAYFFDNPLRRLIHPAEKVLGPYVSPGMTVMDFGCGFGHYSLGLARLVGPSGRVVAVDLQQKMLDKMLSRARKAGLDGIIQPHRCGSARIGVEGSFDFVIISNVLHETPDAAATLSELFGVLKTGGRLLLLEPKMHMKAAEYEAEVAIARGAGFVEEDRPRLIKQMCSLLKKPDKIPS